MIIGHFSDLLVPVLTGVNIIIMLVLGVAIMMQRPKQEGLGAAFGSAMTDQMFGARTTDVLETTTRNLGIAFIVVSLLLGIMVNRSLADESLVAETVAVAEETPEVTTTTLTADTPATTEAEQNEIQAIVNQVIDATTDKAAESNEEAATTIKAVGEDIKATVNDKLTK